MLEELNSFCNDLYYDEVMKTHNMQLCAPDEGVFNLKIICQRKRVNIKLVNNKPTLTLY